MGIDTADMRQSGPSLAAQRRPYMAMVREGYQRLTAEIESWFDVGHVAPGYGTDAPEYEALRDVPESVLRAFYGPIGGRRRLAPDVWLQAVSDRLPADATMDDGVAAVAALCAERALLGRALRPGAELEARGRAVLACVTQPGEREWVRHLFFADVVLSEEVVDDRPAYMIRGEITRPRLSTSDPRLVDAAREVAAAVRETTAAWERACQRRDILAIELRAAGWGYKRIAAALDVSPTRARQLTAGTPRTVRVVGGPDEPEF